MRTTFRIDDDLMDSLRQEAARERTSIGLVVNRLLRRALSVQDRPEERKPFKQESFAMGQPRFDPKKANEFADNLEDDEVTWQMRRDDGA